MDWGERIQWSVIRPSRLFVHERDNETDGRTRARACVRAEKERENNVTVIITHTPQIAAAQLKIQSVKKKFLLIKFVSLFFFP